MNVTATFGTLTDYTTGTAIRPATAEEWRFTALAVNGDKAGGETGAWQDDSGRAVWVDGGPAMDVTGTDIEELGREASQHGDYAQEDLCRIATGTWDPDEPQPAGEDDARAECVRVILDNRLNAAGE